MSTKIKILIALASALMLGGAFVYTEVFTLTNTLSTSNENSVIIVEGPSYSINPDSKSAGIELPKYKGKKEQTSASTKMFDMNRPSKFAQAKSAPRTLYSAQSNYNSTLRRTKRDDNGINSNNVAGANGFLLSNNRSSGSDINSMSGGGSAGFTSGSLATGTLMAAGSLPTSDNPDDMENNPFLPAPEGAPVSDGFLLLFVFGAFYALRRGFLHKSI